MLVSKKYKTLMSARLSNGTIVSVEFETGLTEEGADEADLFAKCKQSVKNDLKAAIKADPMVKVVWDSVVSGVKQEERLHGNSDQKD